MEVFTEMTTRSLLPSSDNTTDMTTTPGVDTDSVPTPGNHTSHQEVPSDPRLSTAFIAVYYSVRLLFSGFAIFGNGLTIVAVIHFERLQNTTNFLICSLAVADMLAGTLTPLDLVHHILSDQPVFVPLCLLDKTISIISVGTSFISIMWIAVDRYLYIAHPLHYHTWVTRTKTFMLIGLTWVLMVTQVTSIFMLSHHLRIGMTCKFAVFLSSFAYGKLLMPQVYVFAVITVLCYVAIGRIAYIQGKAIAALNQPYDTYEAAMNRQQKKIAKMMLTVLGTYFLCNTPQAIVNGLLNSRVTVFWLHMEKLTVLFYWGNTWLNPLIYAWKSEDFRKAFRKLLGLKPTNVVTPVVPQAPRAPGVNHQVSHRVGQVSPMVAQVTPMVAQVNPVVGEITPVVAWVTPMVGQVPPMVTKVTPTVAQVSSTEAHVSPVGPGVIPE